MTLWQILYIAALYFGLGDAIHRHLSNEGSMFKLHWDFIFTQDSLFTVAFVILSYLLWPPTLVAVWWLLRKETIAAVTAKLTRKTDAEDLY